MSGEYSVGSMFAGIGGICLGFKIAGANIVWANEIDSHACMTYCHNFNGAPFLKEEDIYKIDTNAIPRIDILTAGFPCQSFSIAGYRKGFEDKRGILFYEVMRVIKAKKPRAIFLENVKNLKTHDNGNTYETIKKLLTDEGYLVTEKILNTMTYANIPQNRERIYIVGFKKHDNGSCPEFDAFKFPDSIKLKVRIHDIVNIHQKKDDALYYMPDHPYYNELNTAMTNPNTIYQWRRVYVRENKSNVCPTLTANMGTGGHNVPLIRDDFGIRKLTPEECLAFQGFPASYCFPEMANSHKYKQAGNSVSVPIVSRIAQNIISAMRMTESDVNL